jgi:hypothetical protein
MENVAALQTLLTPARQLGNGKLVLKGEKIMSNHLDAPCPDHLEDEAFIIETSGEMPEVALAESLLHLGHVEPEELDCLRAATARGYLRLLARDFDPGAVGKSHFRGLERAWDNLARLQGFLARVGWELGPVASDLAGRLAAFLAAEELGLKRGRGYAACSREQVLALAGELGLSLGRWEGLLERLSSLPCPDFRALAALGKLDAREAAAKGRREENGNLVLEVMDGRKGEVLAQARLPLLGPSGKEDPANRRRAELVWELLRLPPA